jgi:hypothetical protein
VTNLVAYDAFAASVAIVDEGGDDNEKAVLVSAMAGELAGIGLGHYMLRGKDFTTGQGVLVNVGEFAGGLFGIGMAFITNSQDEGYLHWSAAGATGGFLLTYYLLAGEARTRARGSSLNLEICPQALLALARHGNGDRARGNAVPVLRLQYRF